MVSAKGRNVEVNLRLIACGNAANGRANRRPKGRRLAVIVLGLLLLLVRSRLISDGESED